MDAMTLEQVYMDGTTKDEENGMTMTTIITLETRYILECPAEDCRMITSLANPLDFLPLHDRLDGSLCTFDGVSPVVGLTDGE